MMRNQFTGTGILGRSILRRDRLRILIWIAAITLVVVATAAIIPDLYTSGIERQIIAESMKNPAITFMLGPGYGLDNYTAGAMMAHFMLLYTVLTAGIMSILLTTRHTREDEEEGRVEMVRSLPVGTLAPLGSTILVMTLANIILALAIGFGIYALAIESMGLTGSLLYGASVGAVGIFFAVLTALIAQLNSNTRGTIGFSFAVLIIAYLLRGIGDVGSESLAIINPLGLILRTETFVNNYWWPVLATVGVSLLLFIIALYLNSVRDLGAGLIATKAGKGEASRLLLSPLGLATRLLWTPIIAWVIGMYVLGAAYGSVLGDLEGFINTSDLFKQMIPDTAGYTLSEQFLSMLIEIQSIMVAIPVLIFILKLRSEERHNRTEDLHALPVSRNAILSSYTIIAVIAAPIMLFVTTLGLWSGAIFVMDDPISLGELLQAAFVYLPAILVMIGLAVFLIGWLPKLTGLAWFYLGYSFFVIYLGGLLQLPEIFNKLTPFGHTPLFLMEEINVLTMAIMIFIGLALSVAGYIGFNRRDIQGA